MTPADLGNALRDAGLSEGDNLLLHSSFRSLQPFSGDPGSVVQVFRDLLGPKGNLMLPTFNYSSPLPEPYYDPDTTAARTGAIAEAGRRQPEAIRSLHPTHSVAVIGPEAEALTSQHLRVRAFGLGSPIDLLAGLGGKIVLLGVGQTSNSTLHVAEEHAMRFKAPRITPLPHANVRLKSGEIIEHQLDSSTSCSAAFEAAADPLRRNGLINDARCGGCLIQILHASSVIDCIASTLRMDPNFLLCTNPSCNSCANTRDPAAVGTRTGPRERPLAI